MDINDFTDLKEDGVFEEEKRNLASNLKKINEVVKYHESGIEDNERELDSILSNDLEYAGFKRELLEKNRISRSLILELDEIKTNPYFGRMNLSDGKENIDMYIGEKSIVDLKSNQIVYDWRAPVSGLFYQNQEKYRYNNYHYNLNLKRKLSIENSILLNCYEIYSSGNKNKKIVDEFLQRVLENKKDNDNFVDIIKTIQDKQNQMIRDDLNENVIVQGVAGSGKTVIILHRLSYILFNNPAINPSSFMFIAPTNIFRNKLNALNKKLQIDKITINTLNEYYKEKLGLIFNDKVKVRDDVKLIPWVLNVLNDDYAVNEYFIEKYSSGYYKDLKKYFDSKFEREILYLQSRRLFNFDNKLENIRMTTYLKNIKTLSEEKIRDNKKDCETLLTETLEEYKQALINQLNCEKITDENKTFYSKSDFSTIFDLIYKNIIEKLNRLNLEEHQLKEYEKKLSLVETTLKKLYIELKSIILSSGNKKFVLNEDKYSESNFNEVISQLKKYLNNQIKRTKENVDEISAVISKRNSSMFKVFYKSSLVKLNEKFQSKTELLSKIQTEIEKLNRIMGNYDIHELFANYELYSTRLEERNSCLNLQRSLINLNNFAIFIENHKGFIKTDDTVLKIKECFSIIHTSLNNKVSDEHYDLDNVCDKINEKLSLTIKIRNEIIDRIEILTNHNYIWSTYSDYLNINDKLAFDSYYSKTRKEIFRVDAYLLLRISHEYGFLNRKNYSYIYIDEAQDYNDSEIETVYLIEGKPVLNIYGDVNQKIFENVHERKNWNSLIQTLQVKLNNYELNENYRNTVDIVEFCNKKLDLKMSAVGVSNSTVNEYRFESLDSVILKAEEMKAVVITNNHKFIRILEENNVKCYTIFQAKGLEFTDVIVIDDGFNRNQKYVAYTRSLKNLTIFAAD